MRVSLPKAHKNVIFILIAIASFINKAYAQQFVSAHQADAACAPDSQTFTYTGGPIKFVVPSCVTSITVRAWGGGGGGAGNDSHPGMAGGGGAYASSTIAVTPGQVFSVVVGGGGLLGANGAASTGAGAGGYGLGNGGSGGNPGSSGTSGAGGGGGGGTGLVSNGTIVFDAAGGGGGGGGGNHSDGAPGGGGGQNGSKGTSSSDGAGGIVGASPDSIGTQGANRGVGNDGGAGGGGGGGDNAGGGGGAPNCDCGGGGGAGGNSLGTSVLPGSGQTPGNSTYSTLPAGDAQGGAQGVNGGNGYMVISWCQPPGPTASDVSTNPTCAGNDGTATINASSGTSPYSYKWSSGQTTSSANNLSPGSYTVVVKDAAGCKDSVMFTLTGTPAIRDSISSFTDVSVACGNNGTATVGVKGGSGTYTYSWNTTPVQTNATATNLPAGSYTVTVTDASGCVAPTATVTITQPGALTPSISGTTPVSCNGGNNGTATATATGGTTPYAYSWNTSPVQTTATATNLPAGSYTVTVTDANGNGCSQSAVAVITQPAAIRDSISKIVNVLCNGQSNGSATDGVKGGTGAYTYAWNTTPVQTTATATGLPVGTFTVVATDANGCKDSTTATITQPTALTINAAAFAATCNGLCNGYVTVIPNGGTSPYTYSWNTTPVQTSATANKLCAGTYSVVVTDANGCVHDSNPLTVTQPAPIVLTKTKPVSAYCNQADGSDTATVTGGTAPYQYAWVQSGNTSTPIAFTTNLDNVKPGSYCFGVQDANKCLDSICTIIPNTPGETAGITGITPVTCNGGNDGTATGNATGGSTPYTYLWNPGGQSTQTATNLPAGTYTLTVTDATNCTSTVTATVTQPAVVVATATASPATICKGDSSVVSASATGGTAPYSFTWTSGCTSSSCVVYPNATTTYTVIPQDVNKCQGAPVTVVVTVTPPLKVTTGSPGYVCPGFSATITAKASGGNGNYSYVWTPGNLNGSSVSVSPAATSYYTVTVNDGCTKLPAKDSVLVTVNPAPVVAFTADTNNGCNPVCVVFTDKSTISSGSLKSWNWSFGDGSSAKVQDTAHCYNTVGQYSVGLTVTSDSGCSSTLTQNNYITVYDHPHTDFSATPQPTTILSPDITFTDQTTDAYGVLQWLWAFGDPASASDTAIVQNTSHTYADTGTYCVTLKDINKHLCIGSITKCIVIDPLFTFYIPTAFTPNADGKNDVFIPQGTYFAAFDMYIFNRWGTPIYHTSDINKGWNGAVNNGNTPCQEDTYVYVINVTDFKGLSHSYMGKVTLIK